jgi:hypothetical protein
MAESQDLHRARLATPRLPGAGAAGCPEKSRSRDADTVGHVNPVVRRLVLAYSVSNRRRKAATICAFLAKHGYSTVVMVGVAGDSDSKNQDIVEHAIGAQAAIIAAVNPSFVTTGWPLLVADGRALPLANQCVDVVLSNAVIEHVGDVADQRQFVDEHVRVGQAWIITTPNRWFPVESHTSVLFRHWSPRWREGREEFTRLLSLKEFRQLLPEGAVVVGRPWSPTFTARGHSGASEEFRGRRAS